MVISDRLRVGKVARRRARRHREGKLGGPGGRAGRRGTWKDLTDNVNSMRQPDQTGAQHESHDGRPRAGELSRRLTVDVKGEILELKKPITRWSIS